MVVVVLYVVDLWWWLWVLFGQGVAVVSGWFLVVDIVGWWLVLVNVKW